ncbi:MAG: hypothetical protein KIS73_14220 [Enhydrobacter sp.]|nr:hypothetical protein [Enhydrobacter sp.]
MGVALGLSAGSVTAASFAVESGTVRTPESKSGVALTTIRITGTIEDGDAERLRAILTRITAPTGHGPERVRIVAELSSRGGDIYAALNMGYLFKEYDVATRVRAGDLCYSACALAFLGGTASHHSPNLVPDRSIDLGGQVAFHNFSINPNSSSLKSATDASSGLVVGFGLARGGASLLLRYAAAMSIDPGFFARLLGRPPDVWEHVDVAGDFVDLMSCATGIERPELTLAAVAANICNHATGDFSPVEASQAHPLSEREAKRNLLEHVRANSGSFPPKGPIASQLERLATSRDDRQVDVIYEDLRRAGVPLPEILGPTFEVRGYNAGGYDMQCHVSFSLQNPDRYDLAIQGPYGLSKAFKYAPRHCGRLFLFGRDDVINPPRE